MSEAEQREPLLTASNLMQHLRVLLVEDSELERALATEEWDLVLCDYQMPDFGVLPALAVLKRKGLDLPFIVVSGAIGEELAVGLMKAGAHDFIAKGGLSRLIPAIERELR